MSLQKNSLKKGVSNTVIIAAVVIVIIIGGAAAYYVLTTQGSNNNGGNVTPLPNMTLTVVGLNGTTVTLNSTTMGNVTSFTSSGALVTSAGHINTVLNYTGVSIVTLCNLVGGITNETSVTIIASDGYSMVFTYDQIMGGYTTYSPVTGDEVGHNQTLTTILAYFRNGTALSEDEGPLRVAIVGSEGLITDGHFWIKEVTKIELHAAVAEYTLTLNGTIFRIMDRATLESGVACHGENWTDSTTGITWTGIPLWYLVGAIDDQNAHEDNAFNRTLADLGYTVRIIAADGYFLDLNSSFVKLNNDVLLANLENGTVLETKYWPLRLVGAEVAKGQMIRNVVEIQLIFPEADEYTLTLNGTLFQVMGSVALESEVASHEASWTDSTTNITWTGIPLWYLVGAIDDLDADTFNETLADLGYTVTIVANDNYTTSFNSTFVKQNDNMIIACFEDGEPLESKYWPLRLVGSALTKGQMARNIVEIQIVFPG